MSQFLKMKKSFRHKHQLRNSSKFQVKKFFSTLIFISLTIVLIFSLLGYFLYRTVFPLLFLPEKDDLTLILFESSSSSDVSLNNSQLNNLWWLFIQRPHPQSSLIIPLELSNNSSIDLGLEPSIELKNLYTKSDNLELSTIFNADNRLDAINLFSQALGLVVTNILILEKPDNLPEFTADQAKGWINNQFFQLFFRGIKNGTFDQNLLSLLIASQQVAVQNTVNEASSLFSLLDKQDVILIPKIDSQAKCSVAVLNATKLNGLAGRMSTLLERSGAEVIRIDGTNLLQLLNFSQSQEENSENNDQLNSYLLSNDDSTKILISPNSEQACQGVVKALNRIFSTNEVRMEEELPSRYRAEMVIVLNENLLEEGVFNLKLTEEE